MRTLIRRKSKRKLMTKVIQTDEDAPVAQTGENAAPVAGAPDNAALVLLQLEDRIRQCTTARELTYLLTNEAIDLLRFEQAFSLRRRKKNDWRLMIASSVTEVSKDAPIAQWVEKLVSAQCTQNGLPENGCVFSLPAYADPDNPITEQYPLREMLWMPVPSPANRDDMPDGLLLTSSTPFTNTQRTLAQRIAQTCGHAYFRLTAPAEKVKNPIWTRTKLAVAGLLLALIALIPVPLTTLAPAEIVARDPWIVSSQVPGVITDITVKPNSPVSKGDVLFRLNDTEVRSEFEISQRKLAVAQARLLRAEQGATEDGSAKRELAVLRAEVTLAQIELDYAQSNMDKATVTAATDGLVLYSDPQDILGQPVSVGQKIMQIASPDKVQIMLRMPIADAANLQPPMPVKVFLDAQPLDPLHATLDRNAYTAEPDDDGTMIFRAYASINSDATPINPKLGLRGSARISGENVSLFYYIFRRPIIAARQWTGL